MDRDSHTRRGKWSEAGVPKKGWTCVGVEDLEEPSQLCEMCDSAKIRYAHIMEHPDYPGSLQVGCVCAELMEEDYKRPGSGRSVSEIPHAAALHGLLENGAHPDKATFTSTRTGSILRCIGQARDGQCVS